MNFNQTFKVKHWHIEDKSRACDIYSDIGD